MGADALLQDVTLPLWMVLVLAGYQRALKLAKGGARGLRRPRGDGGS